MQARRGELVDVLGGGPGSGSIAVLEGRSVGLVTWLVTPGGSSADRATAEIRALAVDAAIRGRGIGQALLVAAVGALRGAGVERAWLVTTNDNLSALALYQKHGWRLASLRAGAIDELRRTIKPSIPETGEHDIPLRDELELELLLR